MDIRLCKKCGFILGTRPGLKEVDGVCLACINCENKKNIDFKSRQEWLTEYIKQNKTNQEYDCVVGVSGGKDSHVIVKKLIENHGVKNPLLVNTTHGFKRTQAGEYDLKNLVNHYNLDLIEYKLKPKDFVKETKEDFFNDLHPLVRFEEKLYDIPVQIAKQFNIKLVFMGENSAFEYGTSEELEIFNKKEEDVEVIYLFSIHPYSASGVYNEAKTIGFKDLDEFDDWQRQGTIESFSQIDTMGNMIDIYTKFHKFGFQRVSDMACRFVREGLLSREQAIQYIKDNDWICDEGARKDFCETLNITEEEFNQTLDKFANKDILVKDANGNWRRKDLI